MEKPKEVTPAKPSVPDHEVDADKVPTTFPATVKGELMVELLIQVQSMKMHLLKM